MDPSVTDSDISPSPPDSDSSPSPPPPPTPSVMALPAVYHYHSSGEEEDDSDYHQSTDADDDGDDVDSVSEDYDDQTWTSSSEIDEIVHEGQENGHGEEPSSSDESEEEEDEDDGDGGLPTIAVGLPVSVDRSVVMDCPICYLPWSSEGEHRVCCIPCGHLYGRSCLESWIQRSGNKAGKCPTCKGRFKRKRIVNLYGPLIAIRNDEQDKEIHRLREINEQLQSEKDNVGDEAIKAAHNRLLARLDEQKQRHDQIMARLEEQNERHIQYMTTLEKNNRELRESSEAIMAMLEARSILPSSQ